MSAKEADHGQPGHGQEASWTMHNLEQIQILSSHILEMLKEAETHNRTMAMPDITMRIAEECYRIIGTKFLVATREMAQLVKFKEALIEKLEDETRMLRQVHKKIETEYKDKIRSLEGVLTQQEKKFLDTQCENMALQKRLYFATKPPSLSTSSTAAEVEMDRRQRNSILRTTGERNMGGKPDASLSGIAASSYSREKHSILDRVPQKHEKGEQQHQEEAFGQESQRSNLV